MIHYSERMKRILIIHTYSEVYILFETNSETQQYQHHLHADYNVGKVYVFWMLDLFSFIGNVCRPKCFSQPMSRLNWQSKTWCGNRWFLHNNLTLNNSNNCIYITHLRLYQTSVVSNTFDFVLNETYELMWPMTWL